MDMKTSKRIPPWTPKYHRLTSENRIIIWALKKRGNRPPTLQSASGVTVRPSAESLNATEARKATARRRLRRKLNIV